MMPYVFNMSELLLHADGKSTLSKFIEGRRLSYPAYVLVSMGPKATKVIPDDTALDNGSNICRRLPRAYIELEGGFR